MEVYVAEATTSTRTTPSTTGIGRTAAPSGDCISEAQAKRLFAIARNQGYTTEEYRDVLGKEFGIERDVYLLKKDYQKAEKLFAENKRR